jgi:sugar lactone lactonase YvrE
LEKKFGSLLVVIGVHSPKFDREKNPESIRQAMRRYEMHHPTLNDADRKIWQAYGVPGWPTVALIDPEGYVVGGGWNEHPYESLSRHINLLIPRYRRLRKLSPRRIRFEPDSTARRPDSPLYFPGKVFADAKGKRLFIADSTNHRIVISTLAGKKLAIAGTGVPGRLDGPFAKAKFNDPQGLALDGDTLYVADRKNNLIRALDLKAKRVHTVAGTGYQGRDLRSGGSARRVGLNSPWGLLLHDSSLYIAMAGHHQIWRLDLKNNVLRPFAGNGKEDIHDDRPLSANLAQPSGLAASDTTLFVADSEVSAIRAVPLDGSGAVRTLVGKGLFEFGDEDGTGAAVRLQHPMGIVYVGGKLYVADTYNNKIKELDPVTQECKTFVGGKAGTFDEPGGLTYADGKLYVADTNAHRIRVVDVETKAVSTLVLQGVKAPVASARGQK